MHVQCEFKIPHGPLAALHDSRYPHVGLHAICTTRHTCPHRPLSIKGELMPHARLLHACMGHPALFVPLLCSFICTACLRNPLTKLLPPRRLRWLRVPRLREERKSRCRKSPVCPATTLTTCPPSGNQTHTSEAEVGLDDSSAITAFVSPFAQTVLVVGWKYTCHHSMIRDPPTKGYLLAETLLSTVHLMRA